MRVWMKELKRCAVFRQRPAVDGFGDRRWAPHRRRTMRLAESHHWGRVRLHSERLFLSFCPSPLYPESGHEAREHGQQLQSSRISSPSFNAIAKSPKPKREPACWEVRASPTVLNVSRSRCRVHKKDLKLSLSSDRRHLDHTSLLSSSSWSSSSTCLDYCLPSSPADPFPSLSSQGCSSALYNWCFAPREDGILRAFSIKRREDN